MLVHVVMRTFPTVEAHTTLLKQRWFSVAHRQRTPPSAQRSMIEVIVEHTLKERSDHIKCEDRRGGGMVFVSEIDSTAAERLEGLHLTRR